MTFIIFEDFFVHKFIQQQKIKLHSKHFQQIMLERTSFTPYVIYPLRIYPLR